ncbi:hypothetical protein [Brachybacterium]|uniref:DUF4190 domain-containing protein n=2 Tax=Brachybacterium TaxID=43668 RepID=A0A3R8QV55_9MICO|nr:hypothetical protein [Brachybacterium]MCT1437050.1 hypothetical protein [Brachybacterium paraconglomeratum]MCZ4326629.1 hypothetical protein [Brachybacterium paraconglomeratum]MDV3296772.1 hypothetical protein [Brachybacterium paraconglomeratum]RRR19357.1 hypothetical protein DS079_06955 [Brachybacterium paraconglomeratum]TDP79605.1 hypothetical protein DEU31_0006 [Brachybacterium sp. AG952]
MDDARPPRRGRRSPGDLSLALGLIALLCALIPIIGDVLAMPPGLAAVVLGYAGVSRHDRGLEHRALPAYAGAALGAIALLLVAVSLIATHDTA